MSSIAGKRGLVSTMAKFIHLVSPVLAILACMPLSAEARNIARHAGGSANHARKLSGPASPHTHGLNEPRSLSRAGNGPATNRGLKSGSLNSQLQQLENGTAKAPKGKQRHVASARPTASARPRPEKLEFRQSPQKRGGMSNSMGQGSGSKRRGPGRRVTEKPR